MNKIVELYNFFVNWVNTHPIEIANYSMYGFGSVAIIASSAAVFLYLIRPKPVSISFYDSSIEQTLKGNISVEFLYQMRQKKFDIERDTISIKPAGPWWLLEDSHSKQQFIVKRHPENPFMLVVTKTVS